MSEIRLPDGYPNKLTDCDLESEIFKIQKYISNGSVKSLLTGHFAALESGLAEKERRRERRTTNAALFLSFFSICFAFGAFLFSYLDYDGDISWQQSQLEVLNRINHNFTTTNEEESVR